VVRLPHFPPFLLPLIFINLTAHMALSGGRVAGSVYALKTGSAEYVVGVFMALFSIVAMFTALAVGRWVDRVGASRVMRIGVSLVVIGAWLPVFLLTVPTLFVTAVTIGFGFNILSVAAQHTVGHLVENVSPSQRLANFGWFALGHSASSTFGPFIAGIAIDQLSYRSAFALLAVSSCIAAFLVFMRARGLPGTHTEAQTQRLREHVTDEDATEAQEVVVVPKRKSVFDLLATSEMKRIYWVNMIMSTSWDLFIVMLPVFGVRQGFSASIIGAVFSLFALGTFVSRACMPWLAKRATEWEIIRIATAVIALTFVCTPWIDSVWLLMISGFVFGTSVGMSQPNMLSLVHTAAPSGRAGEAVGLRSLIGNSCSVAVPLAFGAALLPLGMHALLVGGGALFATAVPVAHRGVVARRRNTDTQ
jgi:MFS family permease